MSLDYEGEDINSLVEQFSSTDLPPLFEGMFKNIDKLISEIDNKHLNIYEFSDSGLLKIVFKQLNKPKYIYNKGSESIKYFTYKRDNSKREMGIANPVWYVSFLYNVLKVSDDWMEEIYNNPEYERIIFHSNSPILGTGERFRFDYTDGLKKLPYTGIINNNNEKRSKAFKSNKYKVAIIEGASPYYLRTDIENYFSNIYTHKLAGLKNVHPFSEITSPSKDDFFEFLDVYNMSINDNHTKGILQGPISSAISAELLGLHIDFELENQVDDGVSYFRYVDDMKFFSYSYSDLSQVVNGLDSILRRLSLHRKNEKTEIKKGFIHEKYADIEELIFSLPFLDRNSKESLFNNQISLDKLRNYISEKIEEKNITQIRAMLTMLNNHLKKFSKQRMENKNLEILNNIMFKLIYVLPPVSNHCFKVLETIMKLASGKIRDRIQVQIENNYTYISNHFPDTDIEIWVCYLIGKYFKAKSHSEILNLIINRINVEEHTTDPLILMCFIRKNFRENDKIKKLIFRKYNEQCGSRSNADGMGHSRWWPVLVKLYAYLKTGKRVDPNSQDYIEFKRDINKYFLTKNGVPKYGELGIFNILL